MGAGPGVRPADDSRAWRGSDSMSLDPPSGAPQRRVSRRAFLSTGAQLAVAAGAAQLTLEATTQAAMAATQSRPPGLVGMDHAGIMVPNIEEATAGFQDILGAKDPLTFVPVRDTTGTLITDLGGQNPRPA